jgi:flavin-dependent dehydrogenase
MAKSFYETEVFVCGGGPAGLAAAIAARMAGFEVTVADPAQPPIDKACGEGLMPDGRAALRRLGVELDINRGHEFHGIRFVDPAGTVDAMFPHGTGLGMRRPLLHKALIQRAESLGISLNWGLRITGVSQRGVSVNGRCVPAQWIVCADGQQSPLRALAGLNAGFRARTRYGFRRHYRVAPWSPYVEVHWSDVGQMYVTPVGSQELCVAFITRRKDLRFDEALAHFSELSRQLAGAQGTTVKGSITATRTLRKVQKGRIALIGDASGSVDAITGEGMALAFQQAPALARAMRVGNLAQYQAEHRRITRLPHAMANLMLTIDPRPAFRHRAFRALSSKPSLFERLLAVHTGALSPGQFGVSGVLSLGWRLLTA